ncbi:MAG TPA: hypothetical protein VK152_10490 [Paludibacter sp.]|nr:hypothetical protein [Paludibacter sp.]
MRFNNFLILILAFVVSCEPEKEKPEMEMTIGTVCGWCGGTDSLVITKEEMVYAVEAICDRSEYKTSKPTPDSVWSRIVGSYDQTKFSKVNIHTCNFCADGCDTWVRVKNGTFVHEIRFGGIQDSAILKPVNEFVETLVNEKIKFSTH